MFWKKSQAVKKPTANGAKTQSVKKPAVNGAKTQSVKKPAANGAKTQPVKKPAATGEKKEDASDRVLAKLMAIEKETRLKQVRDNVEQLEDEKIAEHLESLLKSLRGD